MNPKYKKLTVRDIVDAVMKDPENFPLGLDTPVQSGDFECNYTHKLHLIQHNSEGKMILNYEMHEGHWSEG